jgi:hypothetical protein
MEAVDLISAAALGSVSFRRQILQEFEERVRLPDKEPHRRQEFDHAHGGIEAVPALLVKSRGVRDCLNVTVGRKIRVGPRDGRELPFCETGHGLRKRTAIAASLVFPDLRFQLVPLFEDDGETFMSRRERAELTTSEAFRIRAGIRVTHQRRA